MLITFNPIEDGQQANDQLFNSRFLQVADVLNGNIDSTNIADNSVTAAKLATDAVTTVKLVNKSVTAAKIEDQMAWVYPALSNGWVTYDTTFFPLRYMKDSMGFVHLNGMIKNGTLAVPVFILPVGFRPAGFTLLFGTMSSSGAGRIDISSDGQVRVSPPSSNAWVSLDGITFEAEQ